MQPDSPREKLAALLAGYTYAPDGCLAIIRAALTPKPDAAPPVPPSFGSSAADEMEAFARWVRSGQYNADDARDEIARAAENRVRELRTHTKSAPKEGERALRGEEPQ